MERSLAQGNERHALIPRFRHDTLRSMKCLVTHRLFALTFSILSAALAPSAASAAIDDAVPMEVRGGTATFDVGTNVLAISIHGKSSALEGSVRIWSSADGLVLERVEVTLQVKTLSTGMGLRDEHMRQYVFTTPDGQLPDLHFSGNVAVCSGGQSTCQLSGELAIRGTPRPFAISLKVSRKGSAFRAVGDGTMKLSAYGIPQPSQLGVKTEDEVKLHVDFLAKPASGAVSTRGMR